ncbi:MAG: hypothetical protein ACR2OG_01825 [Gemmatimonadaceae bacterium]
MTTPTPFVSSVRSRPGTIRVGDPGPEPVSLRVEVPELWDVVRLMSSLQQPVRAVKAAALSALSPGADIERYVIKLRGFEVLDESRSLSDVGAIDGSIFLLTYRRRRPVK